MNKSSVNSDFRTILHLLIVIAMGVNVAFLFSINKGVNNAEASDFDDLEITLIQASDCEECFDIQPFRDYFTENGVNEEQFTVVEYNTFKGKRLLKKHSITQVPTVIVDGDIDNFDFMAGLVENIGEMREDTFVVTKLQPPFMDLEEDKIVGLFESVLLGDESCEECYDVNDHKNVFERLGWKPNSEKTVDVSSDEGKALIEKYSIIAVPTVLLIGDLAPYDLEGIWSDVGTIEEDNTLVLRNGVASMGVYKLLPDGSIIDPSAQPEEDSEIK